jgi:hypothetical protein
MSAENANTVEEMLKLAESTGIDVIVSPKAKVSVTEEKKPAPKDEDDLSDEELDGMINGLSDDDYFEAYDDEEFHVVDDETGEHLEESVDE